MKSKIDKYFYIEKELIPKIIREMKRADILYKNVENNEASWIIKILEELGEFSKELLNNNKDLAEQELVQVIGLCINLLYYISEGGIYEK